MFDGLDRLRHNAVISRDHENYDVGRFGAAGTHHSKSFVAGRIEKYYSPFLARIVRIWHEHAVRTDVLRNTARFALGNIVRADRVEQRCFAVIDVAHNGNDGWAGEFNIVSVGGDQFLELLFDDHFLERDEAHVVAEIAAHLRRHFIADRLVEGREYTSFYKELNNVARRDAKCLGKFANGGPLDQAGSFQ